MLDKKCFLILDYINKECEGEIYKIFSIDDLVSAMPKDLGFDAQTLIGYISELEDKDLVSVKYLDEFEICISPLLKGRQIFEARKENELEKERLRKICLKYSFLGALVGCVCILAVMAIYFVLGVT